MVMLGVFVRAILLGFAPIRPGNVRPWRSFPQIGLWLPPMFYK
jgi:hypothetical protein